MDPIDQRARAARQAVETATSEVVPGPFTPRRSLVAPAVMAAGLLVGGSVLATSLLDDSNSADQQVATESDVAAATESDTTGADDSASSATPNALPTTVPASLSDGDSAGGDLPSEVEAAFEEGTLFVLDDPPPGFAEPTVFAIPDMEGSGDPIQEFVLRVVVYGTPGTDDPFADGDVGIMRAGGMEDGVDGEPMIVGGQEVLVDRSGAPDGPALIVNWVTDAGEAIGVATWRLELDALLPTVELLLDDPAADPAEIAGLTPIGRTDSLGAGLGMMMPGSSAAQVMYQTDPTTVTGPGEFGMMVVTTIDAEDVGGVSTSWLFTGESPVIETLDDGVMVLSFRDGPGTTDSNPGPQSTTVYVPHPTDDSLMVAVSDMGEGSLERADLLAAARSVRVATQPEAERMGRAAEELMSAESGDSVAMVEGVLANGERLAVKSGPEGFCIERDGVETPEGCYEFVAPDGVGPTEPVSVLSAKSSEGDVLLLPFGEFDSGRSTIAQVELRFLDGTVDVAEELIIDGSGGLVGPPGTSFFGWAIELDRIPAEAVAVGLDGSEVSYVLPDIEVGAGRSVTIIGMS